MKTLNSPFKFLVYALWQAIRHPEAPITYFYCSRCKVRFHPGEKECPKCRDRVDSSPEQKQESAMPWWGSVLVIMLGIGCWVLSAVLQIPGLDEVGRALIYIPLGALFGMSLPR